MTVDLRRNTGTYLSLDHGSGDNVDVYASDIDALVARIFDGSAASPITASGPTFKVARTERITRATVEAAGSAGTDGGDQVGAIMGASLAIDGSETQPVGLFGYAENRSDNSLGAPGSLPDACGVYGIGRVTGAGVGTAIGGFFIGRRDETTGKVCAVEINASNYAGSDAAYSSSGFAGSQGLWLNASGDADSAVGIAIANPFGRQFEVGIGFVGQVTSGKTGGARVASIRDDGNATTTLDIRGSHTWGIDTLNGTFATGAIRLKNNTGIFARNAAGNADHEIIEYDEFDIMRIGRNAGAIWVMQAITLTEQLNIADGKNIALGTTNGTRIGNTTSQKVAFHGSTAVVQRAGAAQASVATTSATNSSPYGFTTAAQADAIVTLVNELRAALVEKGLIKGSA